MTSILDSVILASGEHLDVVERGERWGIWSRRETSLVSLSRRLGINRLVRIVGEVEASRMLDESVRTFSTLELARKALVEFE